jgi:hypothetical protein
MALADVTPGTGGDVRNVYLWDVRNTTAGYVQEYETFPLLGGEEPHCLAVEDLHGTLLSGGRGGITCWDLKTGISLF